jgi:hypothetical protein
VARRNRALYVGRAFMRLVYVDKHTVDAFNILTEAPVKPSIAAV